MARGRRAKRTSAKQVDFSKLSDRAIREYTSATVHGIRDPKEKLRRLNNIHISLEIDESETNNLGVAIQIAIYSRLEIILKEILPSMVHQYIIYLVQNSASELPEWAKYQPLSETTMSRAINKPHEYYFYEWTGDLIRHGIRVRFSKGKYSETEFGRADVQLPSITIEPAEGTHATSGLDYSELFQFLEYGTMSSKTGKPKIPPRPFFSVITPKVEQYVEDIIKKFLGEG